MIAKKIIYTSVIGFFLILGFIINFDLDQEFLNQSNYIKSVLVITIIFFLGIKILSELYFFSIRQWSFTKLIVGFFAGCLVIAGVYVGYLIRTYSAEKQTMSIEASNKDIARKNKSLDNSKTLIVSQIKRYDSQISTIQKKIDKSPYRYVKTIKRYSSTINKLNNKKEKLLAELKKIDNQYIPLTKKKTSLINRHKSAINLYLFIAIILELGLILLAHLLSPIMDVHKFIENIRKSCNSDQINDESGQVTKPVTRKFKARKWVTNQKTNDVTLNQFDNNHAAYIKKLRGSTTQEEFSSKIGISRSMLTQYETGRKKPSQSLIEKMEKLAS